MSLFFYGRATAGVVLEDGRSSYVHRPVRDKPLTETLNPPPTSTRRKEAASRDGSAWSGCPGMGTGPREFRLGGDGGLARC